MRLTLRTLLAYLDDVLDAESTTLIGAKIAESEQASLLIKRIRDVMRRRRLTAPEAIGPASGIDPNLVAEYLDNELTPEQVTQIEQVCLNSDTHLAEVAAAHQILTVVLGETSPVDLQTRERMYALGPTPREIEEAQAAPAESRATHAAAGTTPLAAKSSQPAGSFEDRIPEYLREKPGFSRFWPVILVGVVLLLWAGSFLLDDFFSDDEEPTTVASAETDTPIDSDNPGPGNPQTEPGTDGDTTPSNETLPPDPADTGLPPADPEPPADGDGTGPIVSGTPPVDTTLPDGTPVASIDPPGPMPTGTDPQPPTETEATDTDPPEETPTPPAATGSVFPIEYISPTGVLLHELTPGAGWYPLSRRSLVKPGEQVASPTPFVAEFHTPNDEIIFTALEQTAFRLLPATEVGTDEELGLEVLTGRLVFEGGRDEPTKPLTDVDDVPTITLEPGPSSEADPAVVEVAPVPKNALSIKLLVGSDAWVLHLLQPKTRVGFSIETRKPNSDEKPFGDDWYIGFLSLDSGAARLVDPSGNAVDLPVGRRLELRRSGKPGVVVAESDPNPPLWLAPRPPITSPTIRRFFEKFEQEFDPDLSAVENMASLIKDDNASLSEWAVATLAVTRRIPPLVKALVEAQHTDARLRAAQGLSDWLPRDADHAEVLREQLRLNFGGDDVTIVEELLWGITRQEGQNPALSQKLVSWLRHPLPIVRELAIEELRDLTGRDLGYAPGQPVSQRNNAIARWQRLLVDQGGALVP